MDIDDITNEVVTPHEDDKLYIRPNSAVALEDYFIKRKNWQKPDQEHGIVASTTQTQGERPLVATYSGVTTVANINDTVTAFAPEPGLNMIVDNTGANALQIFPASGDNLGPGVDTAVVLAAGDRLIGIGEDLNDWRCHTVTLL